MIKRGRKDSVCKKTANYNSTAYPWKAKLIGLCFEPNFELHPSWINELSQMFWNSDSADH